MSYRILVINPGSTSTKIAVFDGEAGVLTEIFRETIQHSTEELTPFSCNNEQIPYRSELILKALAAHGLTLDDIDVFAPRGGGQCRHVAGTYKVNQLMSDQARDEVYGSHACGLGSQIALQFSKRTGRPAYTTNSPAVDEMRTEARFTGMKGVYRIGYTHALNQKEVSLRYAERIGRAYEDLDLIVAHIGGGVSVTAHNHGRMVDTNDSLNGDGPMATNRTGFVPAVDVVNYCFDLMEHGGTRAQAMGFFRAKGGLLDHLGTVEAREVVERIEAGDAYATLVYDAMAYQIARFMGSMYVALRCSCDAIILTGGIANDDYLCGNIEKWAGGIAPVVRMPGEFEMEALARGALNAVERGAYFEYDGVPCWDPSEIPVE